MPGTDDNDGSCIQVGKEGKDEGWVMDKTKVGKAVISMNLPLGMGS